MTKNLTMCWRASAVSLTFAATALAACGDDVLVPSQGGANTEQMRLARAPVAGGASSVADASAAATTLPVPAPVMPVAPDQVTAANSAAIVSPTMVIRNGTASVEVDSLELAIAAVQKLATSMGGYVGNTTQTTGVNMVRSADIELKIPSARYDATVNNLGPIGKLESQTSTAQDVGEEFYDVTARQANAHRLEERLVTLLATRTGKLEDVLAVERELARVREEIERYEGRLRYLKAHVSTSTLLINLHEKRSVVSGYDGSNIIVESFRNAWRNFVQFVAIFISSLGWIIPLGAIFVAVIVAVKRLPVRAKKTTTIKSEDGTNRPSK